MSWGVIFFFFWVVTQALLPMRRWVRAWQSGAYSLADMDWDYFCWNMKAHVSSSRCVFIIIDKKTGKTLKKSWGKAHLASNQYVYLLLNPHSVVQYVHFLKEEACRKSQRFSPEDIGIRVVYYRRINRRGIHRMIDPSVDLSREPVKAWGGYSWMYPGDEGLSVKQDSVPPLS